LNYFAPFNQSIKKINLHKFVRQQLPDYMIVEYSETEPTDDGGLCVDYIVIKPNGFRKSTSQYVLKINKQDSSVTINCYSLKSVNLELDYMYGINRYSDFIKKFKYNLLDCSKVKDIIQKVLEIGIKYKIYQKMNISPFLLNLSDLLGRGAMGEDVSAFFIYDVLGGVTSDSKKQVGTFSVEKNNFISENTSLNEFICINIPIRDEEFFNIFMANNNGIEEIYGVVNDDYVQLKTDDDLKKYIREKFINASKKSIYYKYGIEDQELNDAYLTLIEMENI
jgi:hypothetical protein